MHQQLSPKFQMENIYYFVHCQNKSACIFIIMIEASTGSLEVDYDENITDLYKAITESKWDDAILALKKHPNEARTWVVRKDEENKNMWRFLPIHSACARQPPSNLISALLEAYPDGANSVDDQKMYALHYACGNKATRDVVRQLLNVFPDACKRKDPRGMLPIHYIACWGPATISVVDMVLAANRSVGDSKDEDGNTPLDLAREGEYPEKNAVIAVLNRSMESSTTDSVSTIDTTPFPYQNIGNNFKSLHIIDEKKSEESDSISSCISTATAGKIQEMGSHISVMEIESKEDKLEISCLHNDLKQRDEKIERLQNNVTVVCDERDGLRHTLADLTEQHELYKNKSELLGDRLSSMNETLLSMMQQQAIVLNATKAREKEWRKLSTLRREKLQALISLEEQDTSEEIELRNCLITQNQDMIAIKATIAAV